jgi:hypothetical protein
MHHHVFQYFWPPQIFLVVLTRIGIYCHNSGTYQHTFLRTIEVCEGLYTSNQADLCRLRVELGAEILTSCALCDSQSGSPLIPRQQTSHVQQDHPQSAASSIPSFCLSTDGCRSCSVAGSCPMERLLAASHKVCSIGFCSFGFAAPLATAHSLLLIIIFLLYHKSTLRTTKKRQTRQAF